MLIFVYLLSVLITTVSCTKGGSQELSRPDCLSVDRVEPTAAVIYWKPQTSSQRLHHIVLCSGVYYKTLVNASWDPAADFKTYYVPSEVHQLTLTNLKHNANYSCTIETERAGPGRPCRFSTNGHIGYFAANQDSDKLSNFRAKFNHMLHTVLLGGVLPMLIIGGCAGTIYLYMRYTSFRQKARHLRQYQRVPTFEAPGGYPGGQASRSVPPSPYNRGGIPPHPYSTLPPSPYNRGGIPYSTLPPSPYNTMAPSPVTPTIPPSPHKAMAPSSLCNTKTPSPHYNTFPYATPTTKRSPYQTVPEVQPLRYNTSSIQQPSPGGVYGMVTSHPATPQPTESETVAATSSYFSVADEEEVWETVERDMSQFMSRGIVFQPPPPLAPPPPPSTPSTNVITTPPSLM